MTYISFYIKNDGLVISQILYVSYKEDLYNRIRITDYILQVRDQRLEMRDYRLQI